MISTHEICKDRKSEHDMEYYLGHIKYFHNNVLIGEGQIIPLFLYNKSVNNI